VSFRIRSMGEQDLDRALALAAESVEAPRWSRSHYEQTLVAAPAALVLHCSLVAVDDALDGETPVGFAVASWLPGDAAAQVENLVVDQGFRRKGIGSALIGAAKDWAANAGASAMRLEVRAANAAALTLYRRLGFCPAGVRRAYYSDPIDDALLLRVPLC
jgi:ribosomal-protein-alanine N-acetyltransferase